MPSLNDLAVAAFITLLVFGGIYVPRLGDALGRALRRRRGRRDDDPPGGEAGGGSGPATPREADRRG
jgi:Sec-independent protein translocase protein TatA